MNIMKSILRRIALNTALAGGAVLATNHLSVTVNQVQKKKKTKKNRLKEIYGIR